MTIPSSFVAGLVMTGPRVRGVANESASTSEDRRPFWVQRFAIPLTLPENDRRRSLRSRRLCGFFLLEPRLISQTATTSGTRSLFKVPVFQADLIWMPTFRLVGCPAAAPQDARRIGAVRNPWLA